MQTSSPEVSVVDTNEEYIMPVNEVKEPPVLGTIFRAVVIETVKDFFASIFGFFYRYIRHFFRSFLFFWSPTLRKKPFDKLDYKENCQNSFELALLVLFMIIFAVKMEWIPETSKDTLDILNNDISQMALQFLWFLIYVVIYFVLAIACILTGRLFRRMMKINITRRESDILSIYLNNAFFSITAIVGLVVRSITSLETNDTDTVVQGLSSILTPMVFILVTFWSLRFAITHRLGGGKGTLFFFLSVFLYTILFVTGCYITAIFLVGL